METVPFLNNELCDGRYCFMHDGCVRYIANIDTAQFGRFNPYTYGNKKPWPIVCPYYLPEDNGHYPQKPKND